MFTFDAIEKSLYNGASPDRVPDAIKNRFSMVFGYDSLDNRFHVEFSKRQIQFFYYDHDYEEWKPDEVKDEDYYKEVGFISLTRPKDTGNDILAFPQNIQDLDLCCDCLNSMQECIDCFSKDFFSFPFVDDYKNGANSNIGQQYCWQNCPLEMKISIFRCFMRCCLLNFVYEFENRWQSFGASPEYDNIRDKLRESDVYKLLSAKVYYTQYLYKDKFVPRNQEKYTYYAQKYADRLMDKDFNKVIPPEHFVSHIDETQGWFYNPEKELEFILRKNCEQKKNKAAVLKDTLVSKIRSFMYSRHAVDKAMTTIESKVCFWISQGLMLFGNGVMITSALFFKYNFWNWYYSHFWIVLVLFICVLGLIYISGKFNKSWANSLFPRILVAEAAAWLTIGIAEDLVKSMLWIEDGLVWFIIIVLSIVGLLVYGESKQHSPYLHKNGNRWKTMLIMNHSLFFALSFGCAMQILFYNNLLKNSDALATVVFNNHFDKAEKYLYQLENLEKSINDYGQFARDYLFNTTGFNTKSKSKNNIVGRWLSNGESSELLLENQVSSEIDMSKKPVDNIHDYHNTLSQNLIDNIGIINNTIDSVNDTNKNYPILRNDFGLCIDSCKVIQNIGDNKIDSVMERNRQWLFFIVAPRLKREIQEVRNHLMNDDYNTLIEWATFDKKDSTAVKGYINRITREDQNLKKCCVKIYQSSTEQIHFFPNLLLLHTLIVLVLAFITQLIISEKSVTEPL